MKNKLKELESSKRFKLLLVPEQNNSIIPPQNQHHYGQHHLQQPRAPGVNLVSVSHHLDNNAEKLVASKGCLESMRRSSS